MLALSLTDLTSNKIKWTDDLDRTFKKLKGMLLCEPLLRSPDFGRPFILRTDESENGAGAVFEHKFEDG